MELSVGNVRVLLHRAHAAFMPAVVARELRGARCNDDEIRDEEALALARVVGGSARALSRRGQPILADAVREVPPLPPEALARIEAGVLARRPTRAGRGVPLVFRFALLTGVVLASVATARGTMILWRKYVASPPQQRLRRRARSQARGPLRIR